MDDGVDHREGHAAQIDIFIAGYELTYLPIPVLEPLLRDDENAARKILDESGAIEVEQLSEESARDGLPRPKVLCAR